MQLAARATIAACERHLRELADRPASSLRVPTRARATTLGGEAALTQLIVTWAQSVRLAELGTYAVGADDPQISDLVARLYGMAAAVCADRATARDDKIDITGAIREAALARLGLLQGRDPGLATRGPATDIVCVDHLARGAPATLYGRRPDGQPAVKDRSDYRALARGLLEATATSAYSRALHPELGEALGSLLYEVFRNTEDHALRDGGGNLLSKSVRALRFNHLSPTPIDLRNMAEDFGPLGDYCGKMSPPPGSRQVHLLEVSVLDSGPGYAQRLTGKSLRALTHDEELAAVHACFSTASSKGRRGSGEGLPHVIRLLRKERGFLRLRTGRLSLFADLGAGPRGEPAEAPLRLDEWRPADGTAPAAVAGTLVTMIIPLKREH